MPSLAEAIASNNQRIAGLNTPRQFVDPQSMVTPPNPPQDAPAGLGLPQRGIFSANLVLASDRSDSSRVFRGNGMRSPVFPFSPTPQLAATTPTVITTNVTTPASSSVPAPTPTLTFADIAGTLSYTQLPMSGVTLGSYTNTNLTVNAEGIITAASNGSGGGSSVMLLQETINFTNASAPDGQDTTAQLVVTGLAWVTVNSIITATVAGGTADHPDPDEAAVEDIVVTVGNLVAGVGFTISAYTPNRTWGHYFVNIIGM